MGKSYSLPSPQMDPWSGPQRAFQPRNPSLAHRGVHESISMGHHLDEIRGDLRLEGIGSLRDALMDLKAKTDLLLEAISLAHQKGDDGECIEGCWSCRVEEMVRGIRVAKKIGGEES